MRKLIAASCLVFAALAFAAPAHAVLDFAAFSKAIKAKDKKAFQNSICDKGQLCRQLNGLACQNQSFFSFCVLACDTKLKDAGFKKEWAESKCAKEAEGQKFGFNWDKMAYEKAGKEVKPADQLVQTVAAKATKNGKVQKVMTEVCKQLVKISFAKDAFGPHYATFESACRANGE